MEDAPPFRKHDRYKDSSYRSYNYKMPERYDSLFWMRFCQTSLWDGTIVAEIGDRIGSVAILDVGCATGRLLSALAKAGANRLYGVDLAPNILDVAREKLAKESVATELHAADAEDRLPWSSSFFDVVTLSGVLHHFYRPLDALREMHRVLRPGGRVLIVDPSFFAPLRQAANLYLRVGSHDGDCHFYSRRAANELVGRAGFHCKKTKRIGVWSYLLIAEKPGLADDGSEQTQSSVPVASAPRKANS